MKVMVAVDESESSHQAVEWALTNLHESISPPILLLNVQSLSSISYVTPAAYASPFTAVTAPPELVESMQDQQKKLSMAVLERAKGICAEKGIDAEMVTEIGDPKESICEAAEKHKVNLLILGSHGRGALKRAFLGSVSNYCVQNLKCPVVVVKKQE